jgi:hypothetical protein
MEAEMVSETLGFYPQLTRLVAREDFIEFSCRESFKFVIYCFLFSFPRLFQENCCSPLEYGTTTDAHDILMFCFDIHESIYRL